jgi:hypothetical protein
VKVREYMVPNRRRQRGSGSLEGQIRHGREPLPDFPNEGLGEPRPALHPVEVAEFLDA